MQHNMGLCKAGEHENKYDRYIKTLMGFLQHCLSQWQIVINYTVAPDYNITQNPVNTYHFHCNNISENTNEWFYPMTPDEV